MAEAAQNQGTRPAPARRWLRRTAAVLVGVPLAAGPLQLPAAPSAQAAPKATGSRSVDVSINSMTPSSPSKSDTVTIKGTVTNDSSSTVTDAHVGLRVGATLNSRSGIDSADRRTGYVPGTDGQEIGGKHTLELRDLPSGITRGFSLSVPAKDLDLKQAGIYQLGVSVSGQTRAQRYEHVLGIERTFLPWQTSAARQKTRLSFMWPLISSPHLSAETGSDAQQTPVFRDDSLTEELAPGGRLQQMVSLGKSLPVTWVVDPDLLAAVSAMAENYKVQQPDGSTVSGKGQAVARQWLSDLQKATDGHEVVALPYGDPDLASLAHRGKDVSGALAHLRPATDLASRTAETMLPGAKLRTDFAWPVDGAIDSSVVDVATSAGAHNVITRNDSLRESGALSYSPTAARPIGGGNRAVVSDARLSTAFEGDLSEAEESTLSRQRFLAQTLMVTMQAPGKQRSIVVAPQRMPTASQARTMAEAVRGLEDERWTEPLDLGDAAKAKPDPRANSRIPSPAAYPRSLRKQELPTEAFREIQRTQGALEGFQVILSRQDRVVTPVGNTIMRGMSTSWRGDADGAAAFRDTVQEYLSGLTQEVRLIQKSTQTLSGRSATIPVTVQNNLVQGVKGMKLVLTSGQPNRLDVGEGQPIRIEGGHSQSVKFDTTAHANGKVWVTARLETEDGTPYGAPMTFQVNVTEITSTVMLVIAGGVLLLVLAGIRMYTQRKRAAARDAAEGSEPVEESAGTSGEPAEATGEEADSEGSGTGAPGSGQQGDVTPDTGPESDDASGTGEKVDR
ncbi:DUF6049 family protein [Streptomyces sp. NPDC002055]|uniref:DUF6049 family protein n=1 Tax=Streptomyces sp. NPDC002055 TaxID=3154534 RepID=UPI003325F346